MDDSTLPATVWVVRAGRGSELIDTFLARGVVAVDLPRAPNVTGLSRTEIMHDVPPLLEGSPARAASYAAVLARFAIDLQVGDGVVSADSRSGELHFGRITGGYQYLATLVGETRHVRSVRWIGVLSRSELSGPALNGLDAPMAVYKPAAQEPLKSLKIWRHVR